MTTGAKQGNGPVIGPTFAPRSRAPLFLRWLIYAFHAAFLLLVYWLTGFVISDIGDITPPDYGELEARQLDARLLTESARLRESKSTAERDMQSLQRRQQLLRDSTDSSQKTMNQLLDSQRLRVEKDLAMSPEEQSAMAEAQRQFLDNQAKYQQHSAEVANLNESILELENQQRDLEEQLAQARVPIHNQYEQLMQAHEWRIGLWKLGVLVPLLFVVAIAYLVTRTGTYNSMVLIVLIALSLRILSVMHEHMPSRYFKYMFLGALMCIVGRTLMVLLRSRHNPRPDAILRQNREAYESFLCPVCTYPIRRGPWKYLSWNRKSVHKIVPPSAGSEGASEEPYICPVCVTRLYDKCVDCGEIRPCLLPACPRCGSRLR
jgi:hypothetical protein